MASHNSRNSSQKFLRKSIRFDIQELKPVEFLICLYRSNGLLNLKLLDHLVTTELRPNIGHRIFFIHILEM